MRIVSESLFPDDIPERAEAERYAEVAVPLFVRQTYTYRLPGALAERTLPGCRVFVPFGKKIVTGYVVALHSELDQELDATSIKDVEELLDDQPVVTEEILRLTHWVSDYYYAPWGECLRAALPAGLATSSEPYLTVTERGRLALAGVDERRRSSVLYKALERVASAGTLRARDLRDEMPPARTNAVSRELERRGFVVISQRIGEERVRPKMQNAVRLVPVEASGAEKLNDAQRRAIDALSQAGDVLPLSTLVSTAAISPSVVRTLEKRGRVEVFAREVRRDPLAHARSGEVDPFDLTPAQTEALGRIAAAVREGSYAAFLLHGVTGSGKTEIYIRAMHTALEQGRTALMLVPEINLTPVFSRRLASHFGDAVAILHSELSDGERLDEWRRIRRGDARVVIGTRSAVYAPLENLGLVVVDEEHETSYKQEETPRYHGRDTAVYRAREAKAVIVLGSATPSLETFHNAHNGKYEYVQLAERVGGRPLASVETIDMREVFRASGKQETLAPALLDAIRETHSRREQSIVLLNRRGFSSFLLCRSCGLAVQCPSCDVTLTYHKARARLVCHYCNHQAPVPTVCPGCGGVYIFYIGEGTEQLEARLREIFPSFTIARLDRDTASRKGTYERVLTQFAAGDIDVLVGTQMIAKGHDFPNVTLVGVVSVDTGLGMPDFRAAERTFQLLTQVAGRAGRGDRPGRVLIQTYHPEHYALLHAGEQDYEGFYEREIRFRRSLSYPPFTTLINCLIQDEDLTKAKGYAVEVARALSGAAAGRDLRVLGPAPAPLARIKDKHRWQVLVKARSRPEARDALDLALSRVEAAGLSPRALTIEVDPVNLM
jgi:primosomal protein N' (replication factor Y) (superfamily II helicase)